MNVIEVRRLLEKAKVHAPDAFTVLMGYYKRDMYRTAVAILMNDEDAADAIQDTVLACWEKIETLREVRYFKTWMTRILINKCYDIRKQWSDKVSIEECGELTAKETGDNGDLNLWE